VRFELLHPLPDSPLRGNNLSCVLRVSGAYGSVLLPGDIAAKAEHELLRLAAEKLSSDILVVPHHGSRSSSTEAFLDRVHPRLALLPVGYRNRYRHPNPEILARYLERGIAIDASPSAGAISITLGPDGLRLERYRQAHRRYWYAE
jgi:competence protein ComEC